MAGFDISTVKSSDSVNIVLVFIIIFASTLLDMGT
jgi:hypothetical protein